MLYCTLISFHKPEWLIIFQIHCVERSGNALAMNGSCFVLSNATAHLISILKEDLMKVFIRTSLN